MDADTQAIYEELKEIAKAGRAVFYGELSGLVGLDANSKEFQEILNSIDSHEAGEGRPLLCALVINRRYRIPGPGFFTHAETLGKYSSDNGDDTSRAAFWVQEVHRVWEYWGRN